MKQIFCDNGGRLSSTRVMAFIAILVSAFITIKGVFSPPMVPLEILITWLSFAGGTKVVQKFAEIRGEKGQQVP